jgi:hypothetical protein
MHIDGLPLKTTNDLIGIFSHALLGRQIFDVVYHIYTLRCPITIDNLTSTQSTFPHNSTDGENFDSPLISLRGKGNAKFLHGLGLTPFS